MHQILNLIVLKDSLLLQLSSKLVKKLRSYKHVSHDVASGSDITLCNKTDKPLVVNRFSGNVMTSIITLLKRWQNLEVFVPKNVILINFNVM